MKRPRQEQEVHLVVQLESHPGVAKDPRDLFCPVPEVKTEVWSFRECGRKEKTLVSPWVSGA